MSKSAANTRFGKDRTDLYSEITDKIIAELAAGRAPWVQPWGSAPSVPMMMRHRPAGSLPLRAEIAASDGYARFE